MVVPCTAKHSINNQHYALTSCVNVWAVLRRMVFNSRRFETLCLFDLHRQVYMKCISHPLAYEGGTDTVFLNVGY
jgi:hypothetical protein